MTKSIVLKVNGKPTIMVTRSSEVSEESSLFEDAFLNQGFKLGKTSTDADIHSNSYLAKPSPQTNLTGWEAEEKLTVEQAWTILCETPDITSPEEYPDHALITMEQLGSFMTRARPELYDANAFMADGEIPMTAAENVLAWMLIEKIGVVDDINYSPKQAQDIIVAAIDDASNQLVEGGEMLLKAEAVISDLTRLLQSAQEVIECASDSYKKRNGHRASFEDDSGEKCWIVPFDAFEGLRSAVAALATTEGQP